MRTAVACVVLLFCCGCQGPSREGSPAAAAKSAVQSFDARGIVRELDPDGKTVVVAHEAVSSYMAAMTMPFRASSPGELSGLRPGDQISFRLLVSATDSWIEQIRKTGRHFESAARTEVRPETQATNTARHPLFSYKFTNELGQAVSLDEFDGQALAITFFFTRCPIPNFCPRLSRNFEEAAKKLSQTPNAPTNWHMLSFSFDSEYDTPLVLKAYAEQYHYDSRHWSFLTGPAEKIGELAKLSGVTFSKEGGFYNHNFRTLIINAAGELQMAFPVSGDLSDSIAEQLRTAAAVTNKQRDPHPQSGS